MLTLALLTWTICVDPTLRLKTVGMAFESSAGSARAGPPLVAVRAGPNGKLLMASVQDQEFVWSVLSADGKKATRIRALDGSWDAGFGPSGLLMGWAAGGPLRLIDASGRTVRSVACRCLGAAASGRAVYYLQKRKRTGGYRAHMDVWRLDLAHPSAKPVRVFTLVGDGAGLSVNRSGSAFVSIAEVADNQYRLVWVDLRKKVRRSVTFPVAVEASSPTLSSGGKDVLFSYRGPSGLREAWRWTPLTGQRRRLRRPPGEWGDSSPSELPGARSIVVVADRQRLDLLSANGKLLKRGWHQGGPS